MAIIRADRFSMQAARFSWIIVRVSIEGGGGKGKGRASVLLVLGTGAA
jgi:hypothetical protein